ncbi:uncharacterized protein EHS24_007236 [Apiotrichum porosum]|uniref:Major facilitator superfamily (MFS) profile domain-containing protein n=1 Tax=Apiotrichum porosum TaxID=105984 RepID=A0A427XXD9_9TREE|nr:uncharacterized protein EHS24_007236 [Apiotrichum porosum]RSH83548.1 hypothetical protein EHS24_007236 [Apiotrichum porosum]
MAPHTPEDKAAELAYVEDNIDFKAEQKVLERVEDNEAAGYVDPTLVVSESDDKRLRRTINRRILPLLCLGYLCQALDKGTVASASIMGWIEDVHAVGQDYAMTATILWCGIITAEPLANQLIRRLPMAKLLAGGICIWSILLIGIGFSMSIPPVFALRYLLGFFESLIGPVIISIMVQWYKVSEQPFVTSMWQCMLGTSSIITSLLAYGFYHLQGGKLKSWQYLHITIAIISFICSVIVFVFLPDSPTKAKWASEQDKKLLVERVRSNNQGLKQKHFKKEQMIEALTDPFTLCLFLLCVFNTLVVGGVGAFGGLLVTKAFGFSTLEAQLLNIPTGVISILTFIGIGYSVRKTGQTCLSMIGFTIPNIVGTVVLLTVTPGDKTKGGLVFAWYLMQIFGACYPAVLMLLARNVSGHTKRSIVYATTFAGWAGGNAASSQLFQAQWAPRYFNSLYIHLGLYACFIAMALITRQVLVSRNNKKIAAANERIAIEGEGIANLHAFEDLTDRANPDFRYCI